MSESIAMIGAGLSGLVCADRLKAAGMQVQVFEKSRGVGGRMATRRADGFGEFDHGAQYFTASRPAFRRAVNDWIELGIVQEWAGRVGVVRHGEFRRTSQETLRYVGVPTMTSIAKHLVSGMDISLQVRIAKIEPTSSGYLLVSDRDERFGPFDWVISSAPAPQSAALFESWSTWVQPFANSDLEPCWALMLALESSLDIPFDGVFVEDSPLAWLCRQDARPSREVPGERWLIHASPAWSRVHLEDEAARVQAELLDAFWAAVGKAAKPTPFAQVHRWRYSLPNSTLERPFLLDRELKFAVCGDWCGGPKIEGAYESGYQLAESLLAAWSSDQ